MRYGDAFEEIKVNDKVVVMIWNMNASMEEVKKVVKVTKTQFTLEDGSRYFKKDGGRFGEANKFRGTFHCVDRIVK